MHIYAMQPVCNYVCMCMWLCAFKLCSKLVNMFACACDYANFCYAVILQLCVHEHVTMHIYALRSARDYACMCMWLCISMLCSQCNYESMTFLCTFCCSYSWWLCIHVHVSMHTCAMHLVCNYVCKSLSYAPLWHAVISCLCMPVHVIMHIYSM